MQKLLFQMIDEAHQEPKAQLKRDGKKMSNWVRKYFLREGKLGEKIVWKKIRNGIDPKYAENFGKYLNDLQEKHDLIEPPIDDDTEDSFEDSDTEVETDRERLKRLREMTEQGYTTNQILEMEMNIWHGKMTNKTD